MMGGGIALRAKNQVFYLHRLPLKCLPSQSTCLYTWWISTAFLLLWDTGILHEVTQGLICLNTQCSCHSFESCRLFNVLPFLLWNSQTSFSSLTSQSDSPCLGEKGLLLWDNVYTHKSHFLLFLSPILVISLKILRLEEETKAGESGGNVFVRVAHPR